MVITFGDEKENGIFNSGEYEFVVPEDGEYLLIAIGGGEAAQIATLESLANVKM